MMDAAAGNPDIISQQMGPNGMPQPNGHGQPRCHERTVSMQEDFADGSIEPTTGDWAIGLPGAFCPGSMQIIIPSATDDDEITALSNLFLTDISSGDTRQILQGRISARLFSRFMSCCPASCLKCLCTANIPLVVNATYDGEDPIEAHLVLTGTYADACPPDGQPPAYMLPPPPPGCTHKDRFIGFDRTIEAGETEEVEIKTSGIFCLRQMNLLTTAAGLFVTDITPSDRRYILGRVPAERYSYANECCIQTCYACQCSPGVPLVIHLKNESGGPITVHGDLVGAYTEVC